MHRTVLITGASRGIGLELARQCAARGDRVLATTRHAGDAPLLAELTRRAGKVEMFGLDVTRPGQIEALAEAEKSPLDLLVCNAAQYVGRGGIDDPAYTAEAWERMMMTNVAGPFFTVRAFLPHLRAAPAGRVAIISSVMGSTARVKGNAYIYRASKAAVTNLACNLARELAPLGVAVGAYHPGWVRTSMGGPEADIDAEESVRGLLDRFAALDMATTGVFEDYRGEAIPF